LNTETEVVCGCCAGAFVCMVILGDFARFGSRHLHCIFKIATLCKIIDWQFVAVTWSHKMTELELRLQQQGEDCSSAHT
jgi:hypothetical protein